MGTFNDAQLERGETIPQCIDTAAVSTQFVHDVQVVHPVWIAVQPSNAPLRVDGSLLPPEQTILEKRHFASESLDTQSFSDYR